MADSKKYNIQDLGAIVDETNQAVATYQRAEKIPMQSKAWGKFAFNALLTASELKIKARASGSSGVWYDATTFFLGATPITASGYYEIDNTTPAFDLEIEWETVNATNRTLIEWISIRPN